MRSTADELKPELGCDVLSQAMNGTRPRPFAAGGREPAPYPRKFYGVPAFFVAYQSLIQSWNTYPKT